MFFEPNEYTFDLILGGRKAGKTTFVAGDEALQIKGIIQEYWETMNQCIIICDNKPDHPKYAHIPLVSFDEFKERGLKKGIIRICMGDFTPLIEWCVTKPVKNCLFIFEDASKYVPVKWDGTYWKDFILDSKQNRISIVMLFHLWAWIMPDACRLADRLELFKTADSPDARKNYIGGMYEPAKAAHARVQKHKSPFHHETIDNRS